jgi:hypothetical protein
MVGKTMVETGMQRAKRISPSFAEVCEWHAEHNVMLPLLNFNDASMIARSFVELCDFADKLPGAPELEERAQQALSIIRRGA